jgi:predicted DNA-binding transcriptional regulator AlpA
VSAKRGLQSVEPVAVTGDQLRERSNQARGCYTTADVRARLGLSRSTFFHLKRTGQLPFLEELRPRVGRVVRYRADLIDQYLAGEWQTVPARRFFTSPRKRTA